MHQQKFCRHCSNPTPYISNTKGYRDYCNAECQKLHNRKERLKAAIKKIEDFGFQYHDGYKETHSYVDVTNRKCGHRFEVRFLNLFTNPDYCPTCGNKLKYEKLKNRNVAGAKPRAYREKFSEYRKLINLLTARTFRENREVINPNNLPMGRIDTHETPHHVDHIVSVKTCFELGIEPERCASVENLRVMPAIENMRKYSKTTPEAAELLSRWGYA